MALQHAHSDELKAQRIRFAIAAAALLAWIVALAVLAVTTAQRPRAPEPKPVTQSRAL